MASALGINWRRPQNAPWEWRCWLVDVRDNSRDLGEGIMVDRPQEADRLEPRDFALRIATVFVLVFGTLAFLLMV